MAEAEGPAAAAAAVTGENSRMMLLSTDESHEEDAGCAARGGGGGGGGSAAFRRHRRTGALLLLASLAAAAAACATVAWHASRRQPAAGAPALESSVGFLEVADRIHKAAGENCSQPAFVGNLTPTLFCWSVMQPNSPEQELVKSQLDKHAGIFACNDFVVISKEKVWLGKDNCGKSIYTWVNKVEDADMGHFGIDGQTTNSFLNTEIFQLAWETLIGNDRMWKQEWVIKVDPDAVFMAERLRASDIILKNTGKPVFLTNCYWNIDEGKKGGLMFGSLEIFSKQAIGAYHAKKQTCIDDLDWKGWGEDMFMQKCMDKIGVELVMAFELLRDDNCGMGNGQPCTDCAGAPCTGGAWAAFHPFKEMDSYWKCWKEVTAEDSHAHAKLRM